MKITWFRRGVLPYLLPVLLCLGVGTYFVVRENTGPRKKGKTRPAAHVPKKFKSATSSVNTTKTPSAQGIPELYCPSAAQRSIPADDLLDQFSEHVGWGSGLSREDILSRIAAHSKYEFADVTDSVVNNSQLMDLLRRLDFVSSTNDLTEYSHLSEPSLGPFFARVCDHMRSTGDNIFEAVVDQADLTKIALTVWAAPDKQFVADTCKAMDSHGRGKPFRWDSVCDASQGDSLKTLREELHEYELFFVLSMHKQRLAADVWALYFDNFNQKDVSPLVDFSAIPQVINPSLHKLCNVAGLGEACETIQELHGFLREEVLAGEPVPIGQLQNALTAATFPAVHIPADAMLTDYEGKAENPAIRALEIAMLTNPEWPTLRRMLNAANDVDRLYELQLGMDKATTDAFLASAKAECAKPANAHSRVCEAVVPGLFDFNIGNLNNKDEDQVMADFMKHNVDCCPICFEAYDGNDVRKKKVCRNNHFCCRGCASQIRNHRCPICRRWI